MTETAVRVRRWLAAALFALVLLAAAGAGALNTYLATCSTPCQPWACLVLDEGRCAPPIVTWTE